MKSKSTILLVVGALLAVTLACGMQSAIGTDQPSVQPPAQSSAQPPAQPSAQPPAQPSVQPTPGGPCYNVLYPFVPGYQWIYALDAQNGGKPSNLGLTVDKVENSRATINALDMSTGIITQTIADCENGAILNYPALTQQMLIGNAVASDFNLEYVSGVFAPAESAFTAANWLYGWVGDYIATGSIQVQDEGETMQIVLQDSPVHLAWQTAGSGDAAFESVTVPAGTFDRALKIQRVVTMNVSMVVEGMAVNGTLTLHTTQWFEPFTGLLKSQVDSVDVTYRGMIFPIAVKGTVELVEFRPGQ